MKRLVIFDLDGTLLNTLADLAESTNMALRRNGFPVHGMDEYRLFVGNGINKLFERALPEGGKTEANVLRIRKDFLACYDEHCMDKSRPYKGIPELLLWLRQKGLALAVASNKYHEATVRLTGRFFAKDTFSVVLGQREGIPPKPDPAIVTEILEMSGFSKEDALYVGDSGVDMQTARNAGIASCGVTWGFRPRAELEEFSADHIVDAPESIMRLI